MRLRTICPTRHLAIGMSETSVDTNTFAQCHLDTVLEEARKSVPVEVQCVRVPLLYVIFQSAATLFTAIILAGATAGAIDNVCWPAADAACMADPVLGCGSGLVGAVAIRCTEAWRLDLPPIESREKPYQRELSLSHSVLLASAPLSLISRIGAADASVGERASALIVVEPPSSLPGAFLHVTGTTAACAWAHGVVQQALTVEFTDVALKNAMRKLRVPPPSRLLPLYLTCAPRAATQPPASLPYYYVLLDRHSMG